MSGVFDPRDNDANDRNGQRREDRETEARRRNDASGSRDPCDVFMRDLDLPRAPDRERIHGRDRDYTLNGSESRALSSVGAFRVVSDRDLRDQRGEAFDPRHLEEQGLVQRVPLNDGDRGLTLTDEGRDLLERHRSGHSDHRQVFYAGADKPRERTHDAEIYRAYVKAAESLVAREARILRVELDRELKRDYQRFLQARNRGDRDSTGRPDRTVEEIAAWAREHGLPYFDDQVHFPDLRIEYEEVNGDSRWQDLEVTTEHYRGGHAAAAARSQFSIHNAGGTRTRGAAFDPRVAEEFL